MARSISDYHRKPDLKRGDRLNQAIDAMSADDLLQAFKRVARGISTLKVDPVLHQINMAILESIQALEDPIWEGDPAPELVHNAREVYRMLLRMLQT